MASQEFNKPPHEILGVSPHATINEMVRMKNYHTQRWLRQADAGDQVARQRLKNINAAYLVLKQAAIEREEKQKATTDHLFGGSDTIHIPQGTPSVKLGAEQERALRRRIFKLVTDWNMYSVQLRCRLDRLAEIKSRHGDRYTRLRATFQRSNMDVQTRWAAERYIRHVDHFSSAFGLHGLHAKISELQAQTKVPGALLTLTIPHVELAEEELGERMTHLNEAFEIMDRKRQYISFYVPR